MVAWEFGHGGVGYPGLSACHHCDNPACCNPKHIWLGTTAANNADRDAKGRQARGDRSGARLYPERLRRGWGEAHGMAKLTRAQARFIKALRGRHSTSDVAWLFSVSQPLVSQIMSGRLWREPA